MIEHDGVSVSWLGHATLRLEGGDTVVYVDPGRHGVLDGYDGGDGDVVCVTHGHHYDPAGINAVAGPEATVVAFEGINIHLMDRRVERLSELPYPVRTVDAAADIAVGEAILWTTAAHNDPEGPRVRESGEPYHPKGRGCGFRIALGGTVVYVPGDTDVLAGHEHVSADVFCPPIGGRVTMDRHEAAELAAAIDPGVVVPIHYDTFGAIEADADAFASELTERGIDVRVDG